MCCFHCKLNHRLLSCVDYVANNERGVGLFGIVRSSAEALTARPANEVLRWCSVCCLLVACIMCVCIWLWLPLCIVISGLLRRTSDIFRYLKLLRTRSACQTNPERESFWSNSNTDAAAVDLSIFVSLVLLLWALLRSTVSSCFFNGSSRWRKF